MSDREYIKKLDDILKFLPKIKDILKIGENKKTSKIESNKITWSRNDLSAIILLFLLTSIFLIKKKNYLMHLSMVSPRVGGGLPTGN